MDSCLICDDHPLVAKALAMTIAVRWPAAAVTVAGDFPGAWAAAAAQHDLCLVDLEMPGAIPLAGVSGIIAVAPETPLIVVTASRDDDLLVQLLALGIAGFLPKTSDPAVIGAAIDLVLAGGRYIPPRFAEIGGNRGNERRPLTDRQIEVAALLAKGHSNKGIALLLGVSPATVKTHVAQILIALDATNRTDAAIRAKRLQIV